MEWFWGLAAAIVLGYPLLAYAFCRANLIERRPDIEYFAKTQDGWRLALRRYLPRKMEDDKKRLPVICCHGLAGNHVGWDFTERLSLARFLSKRGYDVFVVDLRGAGDSDMPRLFSGRKNSWIFDDYVKKDIPAIISRVLEITGAEKVHWMGHSMGGMLAYTFLQTELAKNIESALILASPFRLYQYKPALNFEAIFGLLRSVRLKPLSCLAVPIAEFSRFLQKITGNTDMARGHYAMAFANIVENVPTSLLKQFAGWVRQDKIVLADGADVNRGMTGIQKPMLFIVGAHDLTCMPDTVKEAHDSVGSVKKAFHVLGPARHDLGIYGHNSLLVGRFADQEVYPIIHEWLENV